MSYLVFARKYRPQSFLEVSGQEPVVRTLQNSIRAGRIAHAFLFAGPRGVGKTTTARLLAKALNCEKGPTAEPCGVCSSCRETTEGHSMDVLEIDGASNRGIEDVKSLRESIQYNPARDHYKVVIIDEVHMLSTPAFNALLKTLEEPPAHAKFIFATTELHKVPATILSRCQVHEFRRIGFQATIERLREILEREKITATEGALALIARHADGCLRDAQSALDQAVAFSGDAIDEEAVRQVLGLVASDMLFETMDAVLADDGSRLLVLVDRLVDSGTNVRMFVTKLAEHVRNLLVARIAKEPGTLIPLAEAELQRLAEQSRHLSEEEALRLLNLLALAEEDLKKTTAPRFTLERTLLKLVQARRLSPISELVTAVRGGGTGPTIGGPIGAAGASGAGVVAGPIGVAGPTGVTGPTGIAGPSGVAGAQPTTTASGHPVRVSQPAAFPTPISEPSGVSTPTPFARPAPPAPIAPAALSTAVAPPPPAPVAQAAPTKAATAAVVSPAPGPGPSSVPDSVPAPGASPEGDPTPRPSPFPRRPAPVLAKPAARSRAFERPTKQSAAPHAGGGGNTPGPSPSPSPSPSPIATPPTSAPPEPTAETSVAAPSAEAAPLTPPRDPVRKEAARARAAADPTVARVRDLFKAELVDVDEPS